MSRPQPYDSGIPFQFFSIAEVAAMLRVSSQVVYQLIRDNKLEAVKLGRPWKISAEAIASYINALRSGCRQ